MKEKSATAVFEHKHRNWLTLWVAPHSRDNVPAEITTFYLLTFHVISPNIPVNGIKRFYRAKKKQYFEEKVQDYKDGSGLRFNHFNKFQFW